MKKINETEKKMEKINETDTKINETQAEEGEEGEEGEAGWQRLLDIGADVDDGHGWGVSDDDSVHSVFGWGVSDDDSVLDKDTLDFDDYSVPDKSDEFD